MIDIKKITDSDSLKKCIDNFDDLEPSTSQVVILIAIAEQLKRIADLMQAEKNERRENRLREAFRNSPMAAQQVESKDDHQP